MWVLSISGCSWPRPRPSLVCCRQHIYLDFFQEKLKPLTTNRAEFIFFQSLPGTKATPAALEDTSPQWQEERALLDMTASFAFWGLCRSAETTGYAGWLLEIIASHNPHLSCHSRLAVLLTCSCVYSRFYFMMGADLVQTVWPGSGGQEGHTGHGSRASLV